MKLYFWLVFLIFVFCLPDLSAQEYLHLQYEHSIAAEANYGNSLDNTKIDNIFGKQICCDNITSGKGISRELFVKWKYSPFFYSQFVFSLGYAKSETYFTEPEYEDISINGNLYPGLFNHNLKIESKQLLLSLGYEYNLINRLYAGSHIQISMNNSDKYQYSEQIIIPSDKGVFSDTGTRQRNLMSGQTDNIFGYGILLNFYYIYPLNQSGSWFFSPNITLSYRNASILDNIKSNSFHYSIGININKMFKMREFFKN